MLYSMTGFARVASGGEPAIEVSLRSVNHRFLDLKIRTPPEFEAFDSVVRRVAKAHIKRGAVQINISLGSSRDGALKVNQELAEAYLRAHKELADARQLSQEPDLTSLLRIPGILGTGEQDWSDDRRAEMESALETALSQAFELLNKERAQEGAGLAADVQARSEAIAKEVDALKSASEQTTALFKNRLDKRLSDLLGDTPLDPQRIVQEAAILADRTDISEELQRLSAHCKKMFEILAAGGEAGKKVDFLAQEMNREANTLVSKSTPLGEAGLPVTEAGLRLKAEIEKIREQAQNLE